MAKAVGNKLRELLPTEEKKTLNNTIPAAVVSSTNADLFANVETLYFNRGDKIADVTYGNGTFWQQIDTTRYDFNPSDLYTIEGKD